MYRQRFKRGTVKGTQTRARRYTRVRQRNYRARPVTVYVGSGSETKYFDCGIFTSVTTGGSTWAGTEVPCDNYVNSSGSAAAYTDSALIPSAIGSAYGQIVGNRYKLKKLRVRGHLGVAIDTTATTVAYPVSCRLLLVMDKQPNGAQAQGEDIMQDIGADGENGYSFKRVADSSGRFRILKDEFHVLNQINSVNNASATTVSSTYETKQFSMQYTPRKPINVNIKAGNSTPTVAGLVDCNIFLLLFATQNGSAKAVTIAAASRAYYCE